MASGAKATLTLGCFQNNELVNSTTMQTAQLDPQAQALLNQMSAMSAQAPTPASPLSPEQELAAARLGYRAAIPLAGSSEAVYKVEDSQFIAPVKPFFAGDIQMFHFEAGKNYPSNASE